jgi:4-hydroxy-3-polyprenylbenzoate decarboxylase
MYAQPKSVQDIVDHTVGKALDQFGIEHDLFKRWESPG